MELGSYGARKLSKVTTFLLDVYNGHSLGHYTRQFYRIFPPKQMLQYIILTAKQKSLFGAMLLKEIIKTSGAQLKSRITRQWFTPDVFEKWELPAFSPKDRGLTC